MTIFFRSTIWPLLKSFAKIAFSPILRPLLFFSHFLLLNMFFNLIISPGFLNFKLSSPTKLVYLDFRHIYSTIGFICSKMICMVLDSALDV